MLGRCCALATSRDVASRPVLMLWLNGGSGDVGDVHLLKVPDVSWAWPRRTQPGKQEMSSCLYLDRSSCPALFAAVRGLTRYLDIEFPEV